MRIAEKLNQFFLSIQQQPIELYSEFGLQHDLAIHLRNNYPELKVRLEYPTTKIFKSPVSLVKKEIDLYVTNSEGKKCVIELKMPKEDCGTPNEMYRAIQDVKFLEQLKENGIDECFAILFTKQKAFWRAPNPDKDIYKIFQGTEITFKTLFTNQLPSFLQKKGGVELTHNYNTTWKSYSDINNELWKYYFLYI